MKANIRRILAFPRQGQNPYLLLYASELQSLGLVVDDFSGRRALSRAGYDVLHIHWPNLYWRGPSAWRALGKHLRFALILAFLRLRGTRVVWTLHNIKPHERETWLIHWLFRLWFPRLCTHVMAMSPAGLQQAYRMYPALRDKPVALVPHGHYVGVYGATRSREACRAVLGVARDKFTFLFLGKVRPYKNIPVLMENFEQLKGSAVQLIIAGSPSAEMDRDELLAMAGRDARIHMRLHSIPDDEMATYFGAADVVVLPFREVLNSGSVMLALSYGRRVLAPKLGALPDLQVAVGADWLHLYEGPLTPEVLAAATTWQAEIDAREAPDLSAFEWKDIGRLALELYRT